MNNTICNLKSRMLPYIGSVVVGVCFSVFSCEIFANEERACPRVFRLPFDQYEGLELRDRLVEINQKLEEMIAQNISGEFPTEQLRSPGVFGEEELVREVPGPVYDNSGNQVVPYKQIEFPFAKTGVYFPTGSKKQTVDPNNYDSMMIVLPGIGFSVSQAKSLFDISGTFTNGSNSGLRLDDGRYVKVLTIPMDAPLNGMGENAPYSFGHPEGVVAVMRHVHLLLSIMFPGKNWFFAGRSQGGLNVIEYASRYPVSGVIALNPSSPDREIVQGTVKIHEDMVLEKNKEKAENDGFDTNFHVKSWSAHADYTSKYEFHKRDNLAPVLLLLSSNDWGYPQELYRPWWENWVNENPSQRTIARYPGEHNLWRNKRKDPTSNYESVVNSMARFMDQSSKSTNQEK